MFWRYLTVLALAGAAVWWRMENGANYHAPNLELITVTALAAALLLPRPASWLIPTAVLAVSDLLLGNSLILLFTWSAFAVMFLGASLMRKRRGVNAVLVGTGLGLAGSVWFFLWTNFGVWAMGAYARGADGLLASYVAGVPFFRNMLVGNLILVPLVIGSIEAVRAFAERPARTAVPVR